MVFKSKKKEVKQKPVMIKKEKVIVVMCNCGFEGYDKVWCPNCGRKE